MRVGSAGDNSKAFRRQSIGVSYQDFQHPVYRQRFEPFLEGCFALDLLLNEPNEGLDLFWKLVSRRVGKAVEVIR